MRTNLQGQNQTSPVKRLKNFNSLTSTLNYSQTPLPILLTNSQIDTKINLSKFKSITVGDKIKKKLSFKDQTRRKRNQSMGSILGKDTLNLQAHCLTSRQSHHKLSNHLEQIRDNLKLLDLTLPVINNRKAGRVNHSNRVNCMQLWLDEALDPHQLHSSQQREQLVTQQLSSSIPHASTIVQNQLSTVRKYNIDRQYLRSQNVPKQTIDRLYNSLYIYTYGIEKVFAEMLAVGQGGDDGGKWKVDRDDDNSNSNKMNSNNSNKLLDIFWKSYIKLLQNCTSFQTIFQKIQQTHLLQITHLKQSLLKRQHQFQEQKFQLTNRINHLQKQLAQVQHTHSKFQTDYNIAASALQLTDITLNQQVQLRLKFEQKINHIYSAYEELKGKYSTIVDELNLRLSEEVEKNQHQKHQKENVRRLQARVQQLKHCLQQQKQKVIQRQEQIAIKKQQLLDIQYKLHHHLTKYRQSQDLSSTHMSQIKMLSTKHQQSVSNLSLLQYKYQLAQQKINELSKANETQKTLYEQLHGRYVVAMRKVAEGEVYRIENEMSMSQLQQQLTLNRKRVSLAEQKSVSLQSTLQSLTQQLSQKSFLLKTKSQTIQKVTQIISQLKSAKQKYQTLYNIMSEQKNKVEKQYNSISTKFELQNQQILGLKMLHQNREKHIKELSLRHEKQRDVLKKKLAGFDDVVGKKQAMIMQFENSREEVSKQAMRLKQTLQKKESQITDARGNIDRLLKEKQFLQGMLAGAREEIDRLNVQLKQVSASLGECMRMLDTTRSQLQSVNSLLRQLQSQRYSSNVNLSTLCNQYRQQLRKKVQHIHPMVYEDLVGQFNRLKLISIPGLLSEIGERKQHQVIINTKIQQKDKLIAERDSEIVEISWKLGEKDLQLKRQCEILKSFQEQITKLNHLLAQSKNHQYNLNQAISLHEQTISTLTQQLTILTSKLQQNQSLLSNKQQQLNKLNINMNILSQKFTYTENQHNMRQNNTLSDAKIEKLEVELNCLKQELKNYQLQTNVFKEQRQMQTDPETEVIVIENKSNNPNTIQFSHRNKFVYEKSQITNINHSNNKQIQVSLPPDDKIPIYINSKATQIKNQLLSEESATLPPKIIAQKQRKSLEKEENNNIKDPLKRRQDIRKALKFTYMRR